MEEILSPEQWNHLQIRLKIKFPELSDNDLQYHESLEYDLLRMVSFTLKKNISKIQGIFTAHEHIPILRKLSFQENNAPSGYKYQAGKNQDSVSMQF